MGFLSNPSKSKFKRKPKSKPKSKFKSLTKRSRRGARVFKRDSTANHSSPAGRSKGLLKRFVSPVSQSAANLGNHENLMLMVKHVVDGTLCYSVISDSNNSVELVQDENLRANMSLLTDGYDSTIGTADYCIVASCNEWMLLVCYENPSRRYGLLWNPATHGREPFESFAFSSGPVYKELLDESCRDVFLWTHGVGFDPSSGDYKVVRTCVYDDLPERAFAEVMSLRTGLWRTITDPYHPSIFLFSGSSVYINGFYYWIALGPNGDGVVVSFDFAKEEFPRYLIPLPKSNKQGSRLSASIADYHGSLAAVSYDFKRVSGEMEKPFSFEIWVWDALGLSWSRSSTVDIPAADVAVSVPLVHALGLYKNDNLLAKNSKGDLLLYNLPTRMFLDLGIHHDDKRPGQMQLFSFAGKYDNKLE